MLATSVLALKYFNLLKPKRERERVRKDSRRENMCREARGALYLRGKKEHLVRRYPGNASSSF
jgi:hypothetical protein